MKNWTDIVGYEGIYRISSCGDITNKKTSNIKATTRHNDGYLRVNLHKDFKQKSHLVHRLVYMSFNKKEDLTGLVIHHKNGIRDDATLCNLESVTRSQNALHKNRAKSVNIEMTQYEVNTLERILQKCTTYSKT